MELPGITQAVGYLRQAGLRADRGYPGTGMPHLEGAAVAVNVERAEPLKLTLAATVCVPMELGAAACEDMAAQVAAAWTAEGAVCSWGGCGFDERSGLYSLQVQGVWQETVEEPEPEGSEESEETESLLIQAALWGETLPYLTGLTAVRTIEAEERGFMGEEIAHNLYRDRGWTVTLEELLPDGAAEVAPAEPFALTVTRGSQTEEYSDCRWSSIRREETTKGLKLVRVCRTWTRSVAQDG